MPQSDDLIEGKSAWQSDDDVAFFSTPLERSHPNSGSKQRWQHQPASQKGDVDVAAAAAAFIDADDGRGRDRDSGKSGRVGHARTPASSLPVRGHPVTANVAHRLRGTEQVNSIPKVV